jgi:glutathione S-transferase
VTVLYSFRRCPYAMRARMALKTQNIRVELREVLLRDKPSSLLTLSPKGTVPVLQTDEGEVIDESLDIMSWALPEQSPWFALGSREEQMTMAATFDRDFKPHLDAYKYHRPEGEFSQAHHRGLAAACVDDFEQRLGEGKFLLGASPQFIDLAVIPFVRQFASVDRQWFDSQPRQRVRQWLDQWLADPLFLGVMAKYPQWQEGTTGEAWPE